MKPDIQIQEMDRTEYWLTYFTGSLLLIGLILAMGWSKLPIGLIIALIGYFMWAIWFTLNPRRDNSSSTRGDPNEQ